MATSKKTSVDSANTDAIRAIAQEIRDVPKEHEGSWVYTVASRLLVEALDRGAFSAIKHLTLRALIDKQRERDPDSWEWGVFVEAVEWIERRCPDLAKLPRTSRADQCELLARALEAEAVNDVAEPDAPEHSADFTSVNWFGTRYDFNKTQAECVKLLWTEWEKGRFGLSEKTIGNAIDSQSDRYRLAHTFRRHSAFGTMIGPAGKGMFRLLAPNHQ